MVMYETIPNDRLNVIVRAQMAQDSQQAMANNTNNLYRMNSFSNTNTRHNTSTGGGHRVVPRDKPVATSAYHQRGSADIENQDDNDEENVCCACCYERGRDGKKKQNKCLRCCKTTTAFIFSHIGLSVLVVGYSIAGGFIFRQLESPYETTERNNVAGLRQVHVERLWNITEGLNIFFKDNWTLLADEVLSEFQRQVFLETKQRGWDGKDGDRDLQWSFAGALLYSVTVITTIGYGHIAPKTPEGRLVTIFYALLGIPLTLLCLANMGSMLGNCFRFTYKYTCRFLAWVFLPARSSTRQKHKRQQQAGKFRSMSRENKSRPKTSRNSKNHHPERVEHFQIEDLENPHVEATMTRVPIIVSIGVITAYIFGGAVLFTLWEENWDYLIGSYFVFITLSTIGFGDFVPGSDLNSWANEEKAILCALYLVFGLAVIAMCFNLMQEEVKAKFRWLGSKLGILDRDAQK